ncbi:unnamed protein product [Ambrosiozyma monospora]|uniref:Unnamed protein product n=1 Tax=Ambrosiozyma monospora TaxID=43982 RepID=A0ACB5THM5_AMBMO|nr:unnamed protein product [Ambrosiozyma monospora]
MGIDPLLDISLSWVIEELVFDDSIFASKQQNKFVDFVLAKLLKIHIKVPFEYKLDNFGMELLNHCRCEYSSIVSKKGLKFAKDNSMRFITFLDCEFYLFSKLLKLTKNLDSLEHLTSLRLWIPSSMSDGLDENLVQRLTTWSDKCIEDKKKRVILSVCLEYQDRPLIPCSMFVSQLKALNRHKNFEIVYSGIVSEGSMCPYLLSSAYNISLVGLLDLNNLANHGLDELAQCSEATDRTFVEHSDFARPSFAINSMEAVKTATDFIHIYMKSIYHANV